MTNNRIYIIGSGAVGKVLAVCLKQKQMDVVLLRGSVDDQAVETQKIKLLLPDRAELSAEVEVNSLSNFPALNGMVVLTNKSFGNSQLAERLQGRTGQWPVVILQNGLEVEQPFVARQFPSLYRCVLFMTAQNTAHDTVSYKPVTDSLVGIVNGTEETLTSIVAQLHTPLFSFKTERSIQPVIWKKAIINSVFNSICPLLEVDNGIFHRDATVLAMARRVVDECILVADAYGIALKADAVIETLLHVSRSSDGQLISTLQDIRNHRETEIETLNLKIASLATARNLHGVVKETRLLGELTLVKSTITREASRKP